MPRSSRKDGIVDAAFPAMLKDIGVPAFLLGRGDQQAFAASLAGTGAEAGGLRRRDRLSQSSVQNSIVMLSPFAREAG